MCVDTVEDYGQGQLRAHVISYGTEFVDFVLDAEAKGDDTPRLIGGSQRMLNAEVAFEFGGAVAG